MREREKEKEKEKERERERERFMFHFFSESQADAYSLDRYANPVAALSECFYHKESNETAEQRSGRVRVGVRVRKRVKRRESFLCMYESVSCTFTACCMFDINRRNQDRRFLFLGKP
jgi:hypothetical protein